MNAKWLQSKLNPQESQASLTYCAMPVKRQANLWELAAEIKSEMLEKVGWIDQING